MSIDSGLIRNIISGENAFYNQEDYEKVASNEMNSPENPSSSIYTHNTESKTWRVVKDIFSIIIFPIILYRLLHSRVGKVAILPAATPVLMGLPSDYAARERSQIDVNNEWKVKRISINVDGYTIDAAIMGKADTFDNGRWVLASNGNCEFYEEKLRNNSFKKILSELNSNTIVFNYPGVGASSGMPNRAAMAKAYRAVLNLLEDQNNGIGAREIIAYGHSIGGGVQGDALVSHDLKENIKYCFVKSRTFSDLSTAALHITGSRILACLVRLLGWNMSSVESSQNLRAPEIIMQSVSAMDCYTEIRDFLDYEWIKHDGVIPAEASLAHRLINDKQPFAGEKFFMGLPEGHNDPIRRTEPLVNKINAMLELN
jgi:hypothetical protein